MKTHVTLMAAYVFGTLLSSAPAYAFQDQDSADLKAQRTPSPSIILFHENIDDHTHDSLDNILPAYDFTPRVDVNESFAASGLASSTGLFESFTPRRANAHLDFTYDRTGDDLENKLRPKRGFGFGITSSVNLANAVATGSTGNPMLDEALRYESYELGVNVGYAGFSFDASLYKELGAQPQSPLGEAMQGFDLGLSFKRPKWSTSLSVGSYSSLKDQFLAINEAGFQNSMTAVHLGAVYKPLPLLHLTGGLRYMELSQSSIMFDARNRQMIYLGTRLKF